MAEGYPSDSSDEDLYEPSKEEIEAMLEQQDFGSEARPYELNFGKYKGLTLNDVPAAYITWLVDNEVHLHREDLKAALEEHRQPQEMREQEVLSLNSNSDRKRRLSQTELQSASPSPKKQHLSAEHLSSSNNDENAHKAVRASSCAYRFSFGKYTGCTLDEVPLAYIKWLVEEEVYRKFKDLTSALKGYLRLANWIKPGTINGRFLDYYTEEPLWISADDAKIYFHLSSRLLQLADVLPLSGGQRYWLNQAFHCAKHFRTVTDGSTYQALARFLKKNKRRGYKLVAVIVR